MLSKLIWCLPSLLLCGSYCCADNRSFGISEWHLFANVRCATELTYVHNIYHFTFHGLTASRHTTHSATRWRSLFTCVSCVVDVFGTITQSRPAPHAQEYTSTMLTQSVREVYAPPPTFPKHGGICGGGDTLNGVQTALGEGKAVNILRYINRMKSRYVTVPGGSTCTTLYMRNTGIVVALNHPTWATRTQANIHMNSCIPTYTKDIYYTICTYKVLHS